jgi:hypothetical protein
VRRALSTIAIVVVAVAGVIGLIAFFNSRDPSTTANDHVATSDPGVGAPVAAGALLHAGNVVLSYSDASFTPALRRLASSLGAPDTPALRAAGQAVVLRRDPRAGGVAARALRHSLVVATPSDPRLQDFIERWLGPSGG